MNQLMIFRQQHFHSLLFSGSGAKYIYDRFPANIRTEEQEQKRKQILEAVNRSFEASLSTRYNRD